jgi:hypothetical protein
MASQVYQFLMRSGPTPGKIFELNQAELTIGRDMVNAIAINDAEISRRHARLLAQPGGYVLEDLGSTNGTYVNGQRLMGPHLLRPGELVMFGENVGLVFEALEFDPNATMVSSTNVQPPVMPSAQAYPMPGYEPPAQPGMQPIPQARSAPTYAQQIPQQPTYMPPPPPAATQYGQYPPQQADSYAYAEEERRPNRTWLWAGLGCLVVLLCVCVGGAFVFDSLNLYCTPPFNVPTEFFGFVCP